MFLSKSYRELEERKCTYNVRLRHVCATIFAAENKLVLDIMNVCPYSCLSHTACKTYAPYYILVRGQSGSTIFFYIISKTARFHKKNIKYVLWFSLKFWPKQFKF